MILNLTFKDAQITIFLSVVQRCHFCLILVIPQFTSQFDSCHHFCTQQKHFPKFFPFPFHCCFSDHSIKPQKPQQHPSPQSDCCFLIRIPMEMGKYPIQGPVILGLVMYPCVVRNEIQSKKQSLKY